MLSSYLEKLDICFKVWNGIARNEITRKKHGNYQPPRQPLSHNQPWHPRKPNSDGLLFSRYIYPSCGWSKSSEHSLRYLSDSFTFPSSTSTTTRLRRGIRPSDTEGILLPCFIFLGFGCAVQIAVNCSDSCNASVIETGNSRGHLSWRGFELWVLSGVRVRPTALRTFGFFYPQYLFYEDWSSKPRRSVVKFSYHEQLVELSIYLCTQIGHSALRSVMLFSYLCEYGRKLICISM